MSEDVRTLTHTCVSTYNVVWTLDLEGQGKNLATRFRAAGGNRTREQGRMLDLAVALEYVDVAQGYKKKLKKRSP